MPATPGKDRVEHVFGSHRFTTERTSFVVLAILCIVVTRLFVILHTSWTANLEDLLIYQSTGQAVLAGVNPYDFADKLDVRQVLRKEIEQSAKDPTIPADRPTKSTFTDSQEHWDFYVSSNLPASTVMYGVFEKVANGSRFAWRLLFILGDIMIFFALAKFIKVVRSSPMTPGDQVAMFCLTVVNPVLVVSSTAFPEEKQFQTALMLLAAALLLSPMHASRWRSLGTGVILSLSVLFKLFGIFLFPLWLVRAKRSPPYGVWTALGAIVPLTMSFVFFGAYFIGTMANRAGKDSSGVAAHGSPWVLLPFLTSNELLISKAIFALVACTGLSWLLAKRRIDLLNCCAGLAVVFACFWLSQGAMNREIITLIFGTACLATISSKRFLQTSIFTALVTGVIYLGGLVVMRLPIGSVPVVAWKVDPVVALLLACAYAFALATARPLGPLHLNSPRVAPVG